MVVDGKDTKGLPVDIPTVDYQEVQKTLVDCLCNFLPLVIAFRQFLKEFSDLSVLVVLASDFFDGSIQIFRDFVCFFFSQLREITDTMRALTDTTGSTSPSGLSLELPPPRPSPSRCSALSFAPW